MRTTAFMFTLLPLFSCNLDKKESSFVNIASTGPVANKAKRIDEIPVPGGAARIDISGNDFGKWLRRLRLKSDNRVFLYNNTLKQDQAGHYAVIDISRGNKDLQQCADAVMRIRAEFFYENRNYDSICFYSSGKTAMRFADYKEGYRYHVSGDRLVSRLTPGLQCNNRKCFMQYMETVFAFSGTYNLFEQMQPRSINNMQPGDVFIKPGSPGHAMIVVDMAVNPVDGKKYYMLAQSYMPAQDIHIVINPADRKTPWFELSETKQVITPDWRFTPGQLKCW